MTVYRRVLIGTDGSEPAEVAVEVAARLAAKLGIPATVITVWKGDLQVPGSGSQSWAEVVAKGAEGVLTAHRIADVTLVERNGSASDVLIEVAEQNPGSLLVVGAKGLGSATARLTGSTSNNLSHHSPIDVLFVHKSPQHWRTVGLATDGSATSIRAVERGNALAQALGARSFLVTAAKNDEDGTRVLDEVEQQVGADSADGGFDREILTGVAPAEALVNAGWKFDILVVGNRGMSGAARLLGSVANKVTHDSDANLLLVNSVQPT